jgi:hypothetical protein
MASENRLVDLTDMQMLALKAVAYGCRTNKRLEGSLFIENFSSPNRQTVSFSEALCVVYELIDKFEGEEDGK